MPIKKKKHTVTNNNFYHVSLAMHYELTEFGRQDCNALDKAVCISVLSHVINVINNIYT